MASRSRADRIARIFVGSWGEWKVFGRVGIGVPTWLDVDIGNGERWSESGIVSRALDRWLGSKTCGTSRGRNTGWFASIFASTTVRVILKVVSQVWNNRRPLIYWVINQTRLTYSDMLQKRTRTNIQWSNSEWSLTVHCTIQISINQALRIALHCNDSKFCQSTKTSEMDFRSRTWDRQQASDEQK